MYHSSLSDLSLRLADFSFTETAEVAERSGLAVNKSPGESPHSLKNLCMSCRHWSPEWIGPKTGFCRLWHKPKRYSSGCKKWEQMTLK